MRVFATGPIRAPLSEHTNSRRGDKRQALIEDRQGRRETARRAQSSPAEVPGQQTQRQLAPRTVRETGRLEQGAKFELSGLLQVLTVRAGKRDKQSHR